MQVDRETPEGHLGELDLVAEGFGQRAQAAHCLGDDFGADAVTAQNRNLRLHRARSNASICGIRSSRKPSSSTPFIRQ